MTGVDTGTASIGPASKGGPSLAVLARAVAHTARWKAARALILMAGVGLTSALSVLLLVPLMASVGLDAGTGSRRIQRVFVDVLAIVGQRPTVGWALLAFASATIFQAVLTRLERAADIAVELEMIYTWRTRLFERVCAVNWVHYSRYRSSDLLEALIGLVDRVGVAARTLLRLASSVVVAGAYLIVALRISAPVTGIALVAAAGLAFILAGWRRRTRRLGRDRVDTDRAVYAVLTESLGAMKTIRAYNRELVQVRRLDLAAARTREVYRDLIAADSAARQVFDIGSAAMLATVAYIALVVRGTPPAELFVLLFVFARVAPQVSSLHAQFQQLLADLPAFGQVLAMDADAAAHADRTPAVGASMEFSHAVRIDHVTFGYGNGAILRDVSLRVGRGETVAVVGPSGAGKTTIADIVLGLLAPQSGSMTVDGATLSAEHMAAWRRELGYVPQDAVLFHDTVRANLCWGAPGASDRDVQSALESAAAWTFVSSLPDGLDTVVGDRGVLLSGGERQRLALARALLRQPKLLILDEATSSLDSENERVIERAIDQLHGRTSILLIAHRLSTVRRADLIYVLDAGRVVESGTWRELVARRGRFYALCEAQGIESTELSVRSQIPTSLSGR